MSNKYGVLSKLNFSKEDVDYLSKYIQLSTANPSLEFVRLFLNDDRAFIKFLDICSGLSFKVPSNRALTRDYKGIKMYIYLKKRCFERSALTYISSVYNLTDRQALDTLYRVGKFLGATSELEGKALENYNNLVKDLVKEGD